MRHICEDGILMRPNKLKQLSISAVLENRSSLFESSLSLLKSIGLDANDNLRDYVLAEMVNKIYLKIIILTEFHLLLLDVLLRLFFRRALMK